MKKLQLLVVPAAMAAALLLAFRFNEPPVQEASSNNSIYTKRNIISCSPDWNELKDWIEEVDIPPMPGAGNYKWTVSTKNDSARFYFNQGINMYYGFHIIEAMASFKKAARLDSSHAMFYWAQALAYGPNINDGGTYAEKQDAYAIAQKALSMSANSSDKEKMLILAQTVRYSNDSTESREKLNQLYADKMKEAYAKFPGDADVAVLYADALMLQHPWDLWYTNGKPKEWTPRIRDVLEKILNKNPGHPGANHYYIHVMEPSPFAAKALPSADRLGQLNPGLSHLVHMPSHIYLRTGNYQKGALVNENAVKAYKNYLQLFAPVAAGDFIYIIHNLHMQTNHAVMEGNAAYAIQSANETVNSVPAVYLSTGDAFGNYGQYIHMTPVMVYIRFGKWNELLAMPAPDKNHVYSTILYHFGRGMAQAHQGKIKEARQELETLLSLKSHSSLALRMPPFSPALDGAIVAENLLKGSIALAERKLDESIVAYQKAVSMEENMVYNEPRDWMLNPKHYLGNAFLRAEKFNEAKDTFEKDLRVNNENGWALFGLYQVLMSQGRRNDAEKMLARFKKAFAKADIQLYGPVL